MTDRPTLRRAVAEDAKALARLKLTCFRETFLEDFAVPYPPDDLARFEIEAYGAQAVARELADPTHASWVCSTVAGELVAYAHAGPSKLPHPEVTAHSGELYQLYVRRGHQGYGLGGALLKSALDWLAERYPGPSWLGVWSGNDRAQAVYSAAGFHKVGDYLFHVGDHRDEEYILRRD
ncbi:MULTISPECIES: GNAT family N-acetyltransferase [unclassified Sphingobium]|uniref:GNAT family N-acetyltransferase n=1 Tax=unclassified Sphingobium TaxID=2611147 RepID=UPI00222519B4|nr:MULTISPECIES: N-acetyltransferase [unclassified Sphingobium]MCW2413178.1 ribosomal protein S18 acetylase RimI-like enzyme [Sphingobium sp. B8D3D]MCW2414524.1 ribosomal protein S18 acetylase RimI-like enzyme [Sphingobium sp. B8D3A]